MPKDTTRETSTSEPGKWRLFRVQTPTRNPEKDLAKQQHAHGTEEEQTRNNRTEENKRTLDITDLAAPTSEETSTEQDHSSSTQGSHDLTDGDQQETHHPLEMTRNSDFSTPMETENTLAHPTEEDIDLKNRTSRRTHHTVTYTSTKRTPFERRQKQLS